MKLIVFILLLFPLIADARYIMPPLSNKIALPITEPPRIVESRMYGIYNISEEKQTDVQSLIIFYADKYWVDKKRALRIAKCESWYNPNANNKHSTAWWVFQFIRSTRLSSSKRYWYEWANVFDAEANIAVAIQKMKNEWFRAWECK